MRNLPPLTSVSGFVFHLNIPACCRPHRALGELLPATRKPSARLQLQHGHYVFLGTDTRYHSAFRTFSYTSATIPPQLALVPKISGASRIVVHYIRPFSTTRTTPSTSSRHKSFPTLSFLRRIHGRKPPIHVLPTSAVPTLPSGNSIRCVSFPIPCAAGIGNLPFRHPVLTLYCRPTILPPSSRST